jgi:glutamate synthase domain-containing protein 1
MAGDLSIKDREMFEDMLDVCQLRGRDSTGAIRVNRLGTDYTYAKRVGPPSYLKDSREYENNIRTAGTSVLIGHCRHKTVGNVDVASAHPFDIAEHGIIGVHNGTLKNYYQYPFWWSVKVSKWLDFSNMIPTVKEVILKNIALIRYHIQMPDTWMSDRYKDWMKMSDAAPRANRPAPT